MLPEAGTRHDFKVALFDNVFTYTCGLCHRVFCYPCEQVTPLTRGFCQKCLGMVEQRISTHGIICHKLIDFETDGPVIPMDYVY
jgi:hypothetical protein